MPILDLLTGRHGRLGARGFELPDIGSSNTLPLTRETSIRNLAIEKDERVDNVLLIAPADLDLPAKLVLALRGRCKNAIVIIEHGCKLYGDITIMGENSLVVLRAGQNHLSRISAALSSDRQTFYWGRESTSNGVRVVMQGDDRSVLIGEDCMFASGITIRTSDMHSVIDMATERHVNPPRDVVLEPHIWLGQDCLISKDVTIGLGSIVGAKALVNKNVARFSSVGGVPAKQLRGETTWDRAVPPHPQTLKRLRLLASEIDQDAMRHEPQKAESASAF